MNAGACTESLPHMATLSLGRIITVIACMRYSGYKNPGAAVPATDRLLEREPDLRSRIAAAERITRAPSPLAEVPFVQLITARSLDILKGHPN